MKSLQVSWGKMSVYSESHVFNLSDTESCSIFLSRTSEHPFRGPV